MAIDAGFAVFHPFLHFFSRAAALFFPMHGLERVAIAAFPGIIRLHLGPNPFRHNKALGFEFLGRVDCPDQFVIELVGSSDLAPELGCPGLGNVAVGTYCTNARRVRIMFAFNILLVDRIAHFMTGNTKFQRVRIFHEGVESSPEHDAPNTADNENQAQGKLLGRTPQRLPQPSKHNMDTPPKKPCRIAGAIEKKNTPLPQDGRGVR